MLDARLTSASRDKDREMTAGSYRCFFVIEVGHPCGCFSHRGWPLRQLSPLSTLAILVAYPLPVLAIIVSVSAIIAAIIAVKVGHPCGHFCRQSRPYSWPSLSSLLATFAAVSVVDVRHHHGLFHRRRQPSLRPSPSSTSTIVVAVFVFNVSCGRRCH